MATGKRRTNNTESASWRLSLRNARELRKQGAGMLFERVQLLVKVFDDDEFKGYCEESGSEPLELLDAELTDVACSFVTARAVLDHFPKVDDWVNGDLRKMIAQIQKEGRRSRDDQQRPSWKDRALAAERECERLKAEMASLTSRVSDLQDTIALMSTGKRRSDAA